MKCVFIAIFFIPLIGFSQAEIYNNNLIDTTIKVLYRHFSNDLIITNLKQDSTYFLTNEIDTFPIYRYGEDNLMCNVLTKSKESTEVYFLFHRTELIDSFKFELRKYINFKIYLGNLRDTFATREELIENFNFRMSYEPELLKPVAIVTDFSGRIIKKSGRVIKIKMFYKRGIPLRIRKKSDDEWWDFWSERMQKQKKVEQRRNKVPRRFIPILDRKLKKLKQGDIVTIDLVRLVGSSFCPRMFVPNLRFYIK